MDMSDKRLLKQDFLWYRKESALKVAKRNAIKIPLKSRRRISVFRLNFENRLHRIEQNGVISLEKRAALFEEKRV